MSTLYPTKLTVIEFKQLYPKLATHRTVEWMYVAR